MSTFKRLKDEDVQIIFDCLHSTEGRTPPPHLQFKIVQPGTNGLKLSPPAYEFDDGLYVFLRPMKKSKSTSKKKKTVQPQQSDVAVSQTPPHLRDYIMHDLPPETCPWSLSGPQWPGGGAIAAAATTVVKGNATIQQRYCYPKGRPEYSSQKGGALWTMCNNIVAGKEDHQYRLLHVYLSPKRAANKGVPLSKEAIAAAVAASPMSSTSTSSTVNGKKKKKKKYITKNKNKNNKRGPQQRQLPLAKNKKARLPTNPPPLPRTFQPQPRGGKHGNIFLQHPYHHNYHHYQQQPQMTAFPSTPPLPPPLLPPPPPMLMSPHRSNTNGSPIPGVAIVDNNSNNNDNNDNTGLVHIRSLCGSPLSFDMHQPPFTSSPYNNDNIDGSGSSFSHNNNTTTANFVTPHRQYNHHRPGGPRATTATTAVQAGKKNNNNKSSSNQPFRSRFSATPPHGIHQSPGLQGTTKKKTTYTTGHHDGHHPSPMMGNGMDPVLSREMDAPESPLLPSFHDVVDATGSVWNDPFMGMLPGVGGSESSSSSSIQMMGPHPSCTKGAGGTAASLSPAANTATTATTTATSDDMSVVAEISKKGWADRLEAVHDSLRKTVLNAPDYQQGELVGILACWARSIAKDPLQGMVPPIVAVAPTATQTPTRTAGPTPPDQQRDGKEKQGVHHNKASSASSSGAVGGGNETANIKSLTANTTSLTLSSSPPTAVAATHGWKEKEGHHKIKTSTAATATAAV